MSSEDFESICTTKHEHQHMEWKMKNFFSEPMKPGESRRSPKFRSYDATWYLEFERCVRDMLRDEYFGMFLYMDEPKRCTRSAIYTLGIKGSNGKIYRERDFENSFNTGAYGCRAFVTTKELLKDSRRVEAEDFVTLFCIIHGPEKCKVEVPRRTLSYDEYGELITLSQHFRDLFLSGEGADVTIRVKDQEFMAHSHILGVRSSVFASMFKHDMKEKITGCVDIPDFTPEAFRLFLIYLYGGQVEKLSHDHVMDLYMAADKYDVNELKKRCSDFMRNMRLKLSVESFFDTISFAIRYKDMPLLVDLTKFFLDNVKPIIKHRRWVEFVKQHPVESSELFIKTANKFITH